MYIIVLLLCFFQQNQAYVIPDGFGLFGENNLNPEHLERRNPQILGKENTFIPNFEAASYQVNYDDLNFDYLERRSPETTGQNPSFTLGDVSLQAKLDPPSFESHFLVDGPRSSLSNNVPFSSGNLIDPNSFIRQVDSAGQSVPPPQQHSNRPPMTTEKFVMNDSGTSQSNPAKTQNQNMPQQFPQSNVGSQNLPQGLNTNLPTNFPQPLAQTNALPQGISQSYPQPGSNIGGINYPPQGNYNSNQQPNFQQPPLQQPPLQQPPLQQPPLQQPPLQQPPLQQPTLQQPTLQQPTSQQPTSQQPTSQQPLSTQTNPLPQSGMSQSFPQSGLNNDGQNYLPQNMFNSNLPSPLQQPLTQTNPLSQAGMSPQFPQSGLNTDSQNRMPQSNYNSNPPPLQQPLFQNNLLPQGLPQSSSNGQNYQSQGVGNQYIPPQPMHSQQVLPQMQQLPQTFQMTNPQPTSQYQFPVNPQNLMNQPPNYQVPTSTQSTQFTHQPLMRMPSNGIGSSTLASAMNHLPPEVAQQVMAYYNYDPSHQQSPLNYQNGNWPQSGQIHQPVITNQGGLPSGQGNQPFNLNDWSANGKTFDPSKPFPQKTNSFPDVMNQMDSQLGGLINPSQYMTTLSNMGQSIPGMLNNALASGLRLAEIPLKIPKPFLDNFERDIPDINLKNYLRIPVVTAKALFEGADDVLRILENSLKQLSRRSPDPEAEAWMFPDISNLHSNFNSIPFSTAQSKIDEMRNSILSRIPSSLFSQPFSMPSMPSMPSMSSMPSTQSMPSTSSIPQMASVPNTSSYPSSGNGQPVVKMSSTSVSESTSAISRNGGPPEVSQQASGLDFNYDSTRLNNPINSDFVAMQGYTPNAYDPSQGTYEAVESRYPQQAY